MTAAIPTPNEIFARAAAAYEAEYARVYNLRNPGAPPAVVDARSPTSLIGIDARVLSLATFDAWTEVSRLALELMPDTARDWLSRHAATWGVPRLAAVAAVGNVVFSGVPATAIPSGLALASPLGATYATTASATIGGGGTVSVPVAADVAGAAGSLPSGTVMRVVVPLGGLTAQRATVDAGGLSGQDEEDLDAWRGRILARIRRRGVAGNAGDYQEWAREALPGCQPLAFAPAGVAGVVNILFAMPDGQSWRTPTSPEIATVSAYVNDATARKPLGTPVVDVAGATVQPVAVTLHLNPDTSAGRAAALSALTELFEIDSAVAAPDGGLFFASRLDAAVSNASGEYSHERSAPAGDVTVLAGHIPVLGAVTFV